MIGDTVPNFLSCTFVFLIVLAGDGIGALFVAHIFFEGRENFTGLQRCGRGRYDAME